MRTASDESPILRDAGARVRCASIAVILVALALEAACGSNPRAPAGPTPEIAANAFVVPDEVAGRAQTTPTLLSFPASVSASVSARKAGDILVGGVGDGFLRRITAVSSDADRIVFATEDASLADVVIRGATQATPLAVTGFLGQLQSPLSADLGSLTFQAGPIAFGLAGGAFDWDPNPSFSIAFDHGLKYFDMSFAGEASLSATAKLSATASASESAEISAGPPKVRRYYFSIGPVPVVVKASLGVILGYRATVTGEMSLQQPYSISGMVLGGLHFEDGAWSGTGAQHLTVGSSPASIERSVDAQLEAYLRPELAVDFYDLAGPRLTVEESLRVNESLLANECSGSVALTASVGVEAKASAAVRALSKDFLTTPELSLFNRTFPIASRVIDGGVACEPDAGSDAGEDAGSDAGPDAGVDAGPDAGVDAGADAGDIADAGPCGGLGEPCCSSGRACAADAVCASRVCRPRCEVLGCAAPASCQPDGTCKTACQVTPCTPPAVCQPDGSCLIETPWGATLQLEQVTTPGFFQVPATVQMTVTAPGFSGSNGKLENGVPFFSDQVDPGAAFYTCDSVTGFPAPIPANYPRANRTGGSSFIAVGRSASGAQLVWIDASMGAYLVSETTVLSWEYQIRYFSGDPATGRPGFMQIGTIGNAGYFSSSSDVASYDVSLW